MLCCHSIKTLHILDQRWKGLIYILSSGGLIFSIGESTSKLHTVEFVGLHVVVMSSLTSGIFFPLERGKQILPAPLKKEQILPWRHAESLRALFSRTEVPRPYCYQSCVFMNILTFQSDERQTIWWHTKWSANQALPSHSHCASKWFRARRF